MQFGQTPYTPCRCNTTVHVRFGVFARLVVMSLHSCTFSPVNIARGLFLKAKVSAMQGHNHQTSEHTETDMNGRITTTWSVGCLSELHPMYMPLNKWNHGFAFVEVQPDGDFQVQNKRIHKGEVL